MNNAAEENLYLGENSGDTDPYAVYRMLVGVPSKEDPSMNLVTAGDTSSSYLWHKVYGDENTLATGCANATMTCTDCTTTTPCGASMPYLADPLATNSPDEFCTIANWISRGALNN